MTRIRSPLLVTLAVALSIAGVGRSVAQEAHGGHHAGGGVAIPGPSDFSEHAVAFLRENDEAMTTMMAAMEVSPSGDIDRDFVEMMIPHHQGAIDMAKTVLRYSRNDQIRRLAQEIIVTQQQEIAAMRLAVGDPLPPSQPSPTQIVPVS